MEKSGRVSRNSFANLPQKVSNTRSPSPLWKRALEKCHEELDGEIDGNIIDGVGSLEDLIAYSRTIEPSGSGTYGPFSRLGSTLKFVDDFSAIVAICLGANAKVTAFIWGSLRVIITLASSENDSFQKVLDMLEEVSLNLPRFRYYEENFPLDRQFEGALVDVYCEIICFYARLIRYYRINPHLQMQHAGWPTFRKEFSSTIQRIKRLSSIVEIKADVVKMNLEQGKYEQVLELLKGMGDRSPKNQTVETCYHIPVSMNTRFKERKTDLEIIAKALHPDPDTAELKSYALYGMGGVGKTQLALRYALDSKKHYDTILWIAADNSMSIEQSFRDAANALGLGEEGSKEVPGLSATARVVSWLSDSEHGTSWLLVFDNADDIELIRRVWPANGVGSVLVTSRDFNAASILASDGLSLQAFDDEKSTKVLLQWLGITKPNVQQESEARRIAQELGGLPLALDQIAGFISQRKIRIQDFMPLYERNAAAIDARRQGRSDYPHTLATVFDLTLGTFSDDALHFQNLLAFFEPDYIPESMFEDGADLIQDSDFDFLKDEMAFGDAEETLLQAALINKDVEGKSLSVHRLIQRAAMRRLNDASKRKYFSAAIKILGLGFPDTWSKDVGHQKKEWTRCERYLPHVNNLVKLASKSPLSAEEPDVWAELLLRCSWYLYEREQYSYAKSFTEAALSSFTNRETLAFASAVDLLGLIDLDMNLPDQALKSFEMGLLTRKAILPLNDPLIAFALNNLALAYTEIPDLKKAEECHQKAIELRLEHNSDRIGNSYSNYAVTLLRMGRPDEAERILMSCPSLQNCTEETFLQADNPRFVGDMVLLSRIRRAQGRMNDSLPLASKALAWRQRVHGDRFKTCDSMYDVARLLGEQGQTATALQLLDELCKIAKTLDNGEGQAARAEWRTWHLLESLGKVAEGNMHKENAIRLRKIFKPNEAGGNVDEDSWERLAPYMLW